VPLDGVDPASFAEHSGLLDVHTGLVVLTQWSDLDATMLAAVGVQNSPGIPSVGAEDGVSVEEDRHASGPAELSVELLLQQVFMNLHERLEEVGGQLLVHLLQAVVLQVILILLEPLLQGSRQGFFDVLGHVVPIQTVAVAHREEVEA